MITPDLSVRKKMIEFCVREARRAREPFFAYISALKSAAHLCDQLSREASTAKEREAAKACGDFLWSVADRVKAVGAEAVA